MSGSAKTSNWPFKAGLIVSAWALTLFLLGRLAEGLYTGRIESWGGRVIALADDPAQFAVNVALASFATLCLSPLAIASLGFIPPIGRVYRRLYARRLERAERILQQRTRSRQDDRCSS